MTDEERKINGLLAVEERRNKWKKSNPNKYFYNSEKAHQAYRENPYYWRAHFEVRKALANKSLKKSPCEICGEEKAEAHHWNYKKEYWLDIQWLCKDCHRKWHKQNRAIYPTKKEIEDMRCYDFISKKEGII